MFRDTEPGRLHYERERMNTVLDDNTIRLTGIEALNKALGHAGVVRFLALVRREPTDYVHISRNLYEVQTVDEIFDRAGDHQSGVSKSASPIAAGHTLPMMMALPRIV